MIKLSEGGAYLLNGVDVIEDNAQSAGELQARLGGKVPSKEEAARNTDHSGNGASACSDHRGYAKRMQG